MKELKFVKQILLKTWLDLRLRLVLLEGPQKGRSLCIHEVEARGASSFAQVLLHGLINVKDQNVNCVLCFCSSKAA